MPIIIKIRIRHVSLDISSATSDVIIVLNVRSNTHEMGRSDRVREREDRSSSENEILQQTVAPYRDEHVCLFLIIAVVAVKIHQQRRTCNKSISCLVMRHGSKRATRTVEMGYTIHQTTEHRATTTPPTSTTTTTSTKQKRKDRV